MTLPQTRRGGTHSCWEHRCYLLARRDFGSGKFDLTVTPSCNKLGNCRDDATLSCSNLLRNNVHIWTSILHDFILVIYIWLLFCMAYCFWHLFTKVLCISLPVCVCFHCRVQRTFLPIRSPTGIARNEKPVDRSYAARTSHLSKSQNIRRVRHCVVDSAGLLLSVLVYTRCRLLWVPT